MKRCGKYMGDNDGTCPQLSCVREAGHPGLCDNVSDKPDAIDLAEIERALAGERAVTGEQCLAWLRELVDRVRELESSGPAARRQAVEETETIAREAAADERKRIIAKLRERAALARSDEYRKYVDCAATEMDRIANELERDSDG